MTYHSPTALRSALEQRLLNVSSAEGTDLNRLRRRVVFERILARLTLRQPGSWVVKGGMAVEIRLAEGARMTKDLDLALRHAEQDGQAIHGRLESALDGDPFGDGFQLLVQSITDLQADEAGRPGWRFLIDARQAGRTFAQVKLDVVARSEEISGTERLTVRSLMAFAGLDDIEVEVVDLPQHFAEKLHAMTREYEGRLNTRVKDLADMIIFIDGGLDPSAAMVAIRHVFSARRSHTPPDEIPNPPAFWDTDYEKYAQDLDLPAKSLFQAMEIVRGFYSRARASED